MLILHHRTTERMWAALHYLQLLHLFLIEWGSPYPQFTFTPCTSGQGPRSLSLLWVHIYYLNMNRNFSCIVMGKESLFSQLNFEHMLIFLHLWLHFFFPMWPFADGHYIHTEKCWNKESIYYVKKIVLHISSAVSLNPKIFANF